MGSELVMACDANESFDQRRPGRPQVAGLEQLELHGGEAEVGGDLGDDRRRHPPPVEVPEDGVEALELRRLGREDPQRDDHEGEAEDDAERRPRPAQHPAPATSGDGRRSPGARPVVVPAIAARTPPAWSPGRRPRRARAAGARARRDPRAARYPGQASVSLFQDSCSVSGMTRVSATAVMKLVSPDQRGRTCRWTCAGSPHRRPGRGWPPCSGRRARRPLDRRHRRLGRRPQLGGLVVGQLGQRRRRGGAAAPGGARWRRGRRT